MLGKCKLNNKSIRAARREPVYQAVIIDLTLLGVVSKEECEMLIGSGIPSNIMLPNESKGNIVSETAIPEQPVSTEEETEE